MRRATTYIVLLTTATILMAPALRPTPSLHPAALRTPRPIPSLAIHPPGPTPYKLTYPSYFGNRTNLNADNPLTVEGIQLGRRLFYETKLSRNNSISCASCHQQSHAFADTRRFSFGHDGTPTKRNSMTLTNILWVQNFFWDGRATSLEAQAQTPLTDPHEMGQSLDSATRKLTADLQYPALFSAAFETPEITPDRIIKALTQFERTLISANSRYDQYIRGETELTPAERRGLDLFYGNSNFPPRSPGAATRIRSAGCGNCHGGPRTFNETFHNNGLDLDPPDSGRAAITRMNYDLGRFRVVTLRNIALTAPYMHDGRFTTLEAVIDHYSDHLQPSPTLSPTLKDTANKPINLYLTAGEKADLLAFLNTLTDSTFITDKRFADPKNDKQ
jgi:cytochrome c peroxidase